MKPTYYWHRYRYILVALLAGLSLGVGSIWFWLWPLSLLSFVGVMYLLAHAPVRRLRWYLALVAALAYGCTYFAMYWSTLPLDWLGIEPGVGLLLIGTVWLLTVLLFTLPFVLLLQQAAGCCRRWWVGVTLVPSSYVLADTLGTFLFSVVLAGPHSTLGLDYSMGSAGYQLADSNLLRQVAWAGGLYGLLFVQAAFGVVGYYVLRAAGQWRWWSGGVWLLVWLVLASNLVRVPADSLSTADDTVTVGVVGTFSGDTISATPAEQLQYSIYRLPPDIDVIALPEDTRFVQYMHPERAEELAAYFTNAIVLDSGSIRTATGFQPEIQLYHTATGQLATSSKEFLMVFGEYLPWLYRGVGNLLGLDSVVAQLDEEHRYFVTEPRPLAVNDIPISVKLCSDAISPRIYQRETLAGATMLFNLASHGWFHHSTVLHNMAIRGGQVRAVENGRWYIRAGHDTPAMVIDQRGTVVAAQRWFSVEPLAVTVPVREHRTLYGLIGPWVLLAPLLVLVIHQVSVRVRQRRNTRGRLG